MSYTNTSMGAFDVPMDSISQARTCIPDMTCEIGISLARCTYLGLNRVLLKCFVLSTWVGNRRYPLK